MDENNNNKNEKLKEEQQASDETHTELREIAKEELEQILENHKKWLESSGKEGERANLRNANLKKAELNKTNLEKADLRNSNLKHASLRESNFRKANFGKSNLKFAKLNDANLQKANFDEANLQKANFFEANLQKADLSNAHLQKAFLNRANLQKAELYNANLYKATLLRANLQKAILSKTNLHKADLGKANIQNTELDGIKGLNEAKNLQYADFRGATGLLGDEFAQADVTGTKLPDDIKEFKALDVVEKTSENARKMFFAMLLGCVYSWLTIATTQDARLLTNTASSPLPIIGSQIPIAWFYIVAPLVLLCLYLYFHLYLDNLWKGLAGLPAIFKDGKPLDETAYPWLLNSIVCRYFKMLMDRSMFAHLKEWITIFLSWWVVPITMIGFWLRYLPRRDWFGTVLHICLITISFFSAIIFYRLCANILQGKKGNDLDPRFQNFWKYKRTYYILSFSFIILFFSVLSFGAINGIRTYQNFKFTNISHFNPKTIVPTIFYFFGYDLFISFREQDVSQKPQNYYDINSFDERLRSLKVAKLSRSNLRYADMYKAFLVGADLRESDLYGSNMKQADLRVSDLKNSRLQNANLDYADLTLADLSGANFDNASIEGAIFESANLKSAYHLTLYQLSKVKTLYKANLDVELLQQLINCCPHLFKKAERRNSQNKIEN